MAPLKRIVGVLLVIIAAASLVVSVGVVAGVWSVRSQMAASLVSVLELANQTLANTNSTLEVVDEGLVAAGVSVASAKGTFDALADTVAQTGPSLEAASTFLGQELPETLSSAQQTIASAAESARVIDGVLSLLGGLPLLRIDYEPEVPLNKSLAGIGKSLDGVPESLEQLGTALAGPAETLPALSQNLSSMGASFTDIEATMAGARVTVSTYRDLIGQYQALIVGLQQAVPTLVTAVPLLVSFFFFWLAILQLGVLIKGVEWMRGPREQAPVPVAGASAAASMPDAGSAAAPAAS